MTLGVIHGMTDMHMMDPGRNPPDLMIRHLKDAEMTGRIHGFGNCTTHSKD